MPLGVPWVSLGCLLGVPECLLAAARRLLGLLGVSWLLLGASWVSPGCPSVLLSASWVSPGCLQGAPGCSWVRATRCPSTAVSLIASMSVELIPCLVTIMLKQLVLSLGWRISSGLWLSL